ncbi:hypothetical protein HAX54_045803 [Datura stramonium]|uniref:Pentatricopeptide repeat-containing protein n=1 Tax=Datura stramonium TaxID=4076 RepID=A0ABS8SQK6_DATST|nr:hypothetical protein [Datura stramonium]
MDFENDPYVYSSMLSMYARIGLLEDADRTFDSVLDKEVEVWNSMISVYVGKGRGDNALCVYNEIQSRGIPFDSFTLSNILISYSMTESYDLGRAVHGELIKKPIQNNITLQSALVTMYSKCGILEAALIFSRMEEKDVVAWGSMISGLCQNKSGEELDSAVRSPLVDFYSNCGQLEMAEKMAQTGHKPGREQLYLAAHKKEDGSYVNEAAKEICISTYFELEKIELDVSQSTVNESEVSLNNAIGKVLGNKHSRRPSDAPCGPLPDVDRRSFGGSNSSDND